MSGSRRWPLRRTAALTALATLLLVSLKLSGVIAWPWWQILAPAFLAAGAVLYVLSALAIAWLARQ